MILSLIPTAMGTAYACMAGLQPDELIDAGVITPSSLASVLKDPPSDVAQYLIDADLRTLMRITGMTMDVLDLADEHMPSRILVRVPCAKMGLQPPGRSSQAMYGLAAGAVWSAMINRWPSRCIPITDRRWRVERGDKQAMLDDVRRIYQAFDAGDDPRGDVCNAIALARWAIRGKAAST